MGSQLTPQNNPGKNLTEVKNNSSPELTGFFGNLNMKKWSVVKEKLWTRNLQTDLAYAHKELLTVKSA